jgi:hypothetical protein
MGRSLTLLKVLGLISVLTGSLVLSCLGNDALYRPPVERILITGSLG